jgi:hypothetical protein
VLSKFIATGAVVIIVVATGAVIVVIVATGAVVAIGAVVATGTVVVVIVIVVVGGPSVVVVVVGGLFAAAQTVIVVVVVGGASMSALAFVPGVVGLLASSFAMGNPWTLALAPVVVEGPASFSWEPREGAVPPWETTGGGSQGFGTGGWAFAAFAAFVGLVVLIAVLAGVAAAAAAAAVVIVFVLCFFVAVVLVVIVLVIVVIVVVVVFIVAVVLCFWAAGLADASGGGELRGRRDGGIPGTGTLWGGHRDATFVKHRLGTVVNNRQ